MTEVKRELESPTPSPSPRQKRPRISSSNILSDRENSSSSNQAPLRTSSHPDLTSINATIAKLEAELAELRQQQQDDRAHTQSALDVQNSRIEGLERNPTGQVVLDRSSESPRPTADHLNVHGGEPKSNVGTPNKPDLHGATPPAPSPSIPPRNIKTYFLRQLFSREKSWLAHSDNQTWSMRHGTAKNILKIFDENGTSVTALLPNSVNFLEWNRKGHKVIIHKHRDRNVSTALELCVELSSAVQCKKFIRAMKTKCKIKSIPKGLNYMNNAFDTISKTVKHRYRTRSSEQSTRPTEVQADDVPLGRANPARKSANNPSAFEADDGLSVMQNSNIILYDGMPMPTLVQNLPSLEVPELPDNPNEELPYNFLKKVLGGSTIGNGSYAVSAKKVRGAEAPLFPNVKLWTVLNRTCDPLLPRFPAHGARVSGFMQYNNNEDPFPLFIRSGVGYRYYGMYKEPRASDTIGSNDMALILRSVKEHHARLLGTQHKNGKSQKTITTLREMWPPVSVGWWDADTRTMIDYNGDLEEEHGEFEVLKRLITEEEAENITPDEILAAFDTPDYELPPSARLCYEYLQCVSYDKSFYDQLVTRKRQDEA
ncbi:uncharacterized protein PAC_12398 [Phialocephala subalpina]|uniref:Uncharacterized protein n=1 Tax=Phialocephala subalpina TaxID=576137 RepID=A0A1L7XBW1_9HELO|nr:uncharacterized protein PAC_12398 [Phialocephala subalpina]